MHIAQHILTNPLNSGISSCAAQSASSKPNTWQSTGKDLVLKTEMQAISIDNILLTPLDLVGIKILILDRLN